MLLSVADLSDSAERLVAFIENSIQFTPKALQSPHESPADFRSKMGVFRAVFRTFSGSAPTFDQKCTANCSNHSFYAGPSPVQDRENHSFFLADFGRFLGMRKRRSPLEYPVTIRQVEGYLIFSVKDLGITLTEELPAGGKITPDFMRKATTLLAKSWLKSNERIKVLIDHGKPLPDPSKIRVATKEIKKAKPLTAPEVAKLLGVSENTVRRIPKAELRYRRTKGGHRRYAIGAVTMYREMFAGPVQTESSDEDQGWPG